jgi:branched-chain amino acid transport system permease protein
MTTALLILTLGSLYALVAAGLVVVYRTSRVLNFAAGELAMISAYLSATIAGAVGSVALGWLLSIAVSGAAGLLVYLLLMRPVLGQPRFVGILLTVGLAILLRALTVILFGAELRFLSVFPSGSWRVLEAELLLSNVYSTLTAAGTFALIYAFYERSRVGVRMRAVAENVILAGQRGINLDRMFATAWMVALVAGSVAGTLYASRGILDVSLASIGLKGITGALIGGLDSLRGAALGGLVVAVVEYYVTTMLDARLSEVIPILLVLSILILRPWGLFGTSEEVERV